MAFVASSVTESQSSYGQSDLMHLRQRELEDRRESEECFPVRLFPFKFQACFTALNLILMFFCSHLVFLNPAFTPWSRTKPSDFTDAEARTGVRVAGGDVLQLPFTVFILGLSTQREREAKWKSFSAVRDHFTCCQSSHWASHMPSALSSPTPSLQQAAQSKACYHFNEITVIQR